MKPVAEIVIMFIHTWMIRPNGSLPVKQSEMSKEQTFCFILIADNRKGICETYNLYFHASDDLY